MAFHLLILKVTQAFLLNKLLGSLELTKVVNEVERYH